MNIAARLEEIAKHLRQCNTCSSKRRTDCRVLVETPNELERIARWLRAAGIEEVPLHALDQTQT